MDKKIFSNNFISVGFTLVEILVVTAILGVLSTITLASFSQYNTNRTLNEQTAQFVNALHTAKSRAQSQVKPEECEDIPLLAHRVQISSEREYQVEAICRTPAGSRAFSHGPDAFRLPAGYSFSPQPQTVTFFVITGEVRVGGTTPAPSSSIVLQADGPSLTRTVTIDTQGNISGDFR